jgi:chaperonin GroEL
MEWLVASFVGLPLTLIFIVWWIHYCDSIGIEHANMINSIEEEMKIDETEHSEDRRVRHLGAKGIMDPTKVVRTAPQDPASIADLLVTTEAMVAEVRKKQSPVMPAGPGAANGGWTAWKTSY